MPIVYKCIIIFHRQDCNSWSSLKPITFVFFDTNEQHLDVSVTPSQLLGMNESGLPNCKGGIVEGPMFDGNKQTTRIFEQQNTNTIEQTDNYELLLYSFFIQRKKAWRTSTLFLEVLSYVRSYCYCWPLCPILFLRWFGSNIWSK